MCKKTGAVTIVVTGDWQRSSLLNRTTAARCASVFISTHEWLSQHITSQQELVLLMFSVVLQNYRTYLPGSSCSVSILNTSDSTTDVQKFPEFADFLSSVLQFWSRQTRLRLERMDWFLSSSRAENSHVWMAAEPEVDLFWGFCLLNILPYHQMLVTTYKPTLTSFNDCFMVLMLLYRWFHPDE